MVKKESDSVQDSRVMAHMSPVQMIAFKKGDKKMDENKAMSRSKDKAEDKALAKKVTKKFPAKKK